MDRNRRKRDKALGRGMTRRKFLAETSRWAVGAALAGVLASDTAPAAGESQNILNYHPRMHYRRLGKTGLMLSEISLGGHWKNREGGRLWLKFAQEEVPSDVAQNRTEVVSRCIDLGINYLDITTPAECLAYGVALRGRREKMYVGADDSYLCPRDPANRTVERLVLDVEECLRRLNTDYLDLWRVQADVAGRHPDEEVEVMVEAFEKVHEQGKVRWFGISSHNRQFLQHVVETFPQIAVVIFPYTARSKPHPGGGQPQVEEAPAGPGGKDFTTSIFETARKHEVGIITIKPFAGGSLFRIGAKFPIEDKGPEEDHKLARLTLRYILLNEHITATVPGMTTVYEVENNVRASYERTVALNPAERQKLSQATARMWANLPAEYHWLHEWEWV